MPIGRDEGKWFVWRGLRVVGKVAEACEWGFGGGVILWGWGRKVLKGWRLVGGRRGPRFRASGKTVHLKGRRPTLPRSPLGSATPG